MGWFHTSQSKYLHAIPGQTIKFLNMIPIMTRIGISRAAKLHVQIQMYLLR